jgi:pre-60S factor REI1
MKRRVAGLPPVSLVIFNQKVIDRKVETAVMSSTKDSTCDLCRYVPSERLYNNCGLLEDRKIYTTENAYRSHINSKKHRDNELQAALRLSLTSSAPTEAAPEAEAATEEAPESAPEPIQVDPPSPEEAAEPAAVTLQVDEDADEDDVNDTIDAKIAAARSRLNPSACLFCPAQASSIETNLSHMHTAHSFFIPDADYLVDLSGLLTYLGEKIAVGNVCIYCNGKGREFRTLDAVRKHMLDKGHCKIAYEKSKDQLEISDFYDFRSSYPEAAPKKVKKLKNPAVTGIVPDAEQGEWEDVSDDGSDADEVVEQSDSDDDDNETSEEESEAESLPENPISYGDSPYELVLASGARIGHRSLKRYYAQSFPGAPRGKPEDPNSGAALVRKLLADKNSALVPSKGGFGAFGAGTQVVKARNRGEAREAGRHTREFRDIVRKEQYKTRVAYQNNYQKHFRDPLLQ